MSEAERGVTLTGVPNPERYVLEADALRRRQLRSALLHGSGRTWRERPRVWPAALGGIVAVIVVVAIVAIVGAFHRQQQITEERQREQQRLRNPAPTASLAPSR